MEKTNQNSKNIFQRLFNSSIGFIEGLCLSLPVGLHTVLHNWFKDLMVLINSPNAENALRVAVADPFISLGVMMQGVIFTPFQSAIAGFKLNNDDEFILKSIAKSIYENYYKPTFKLGDGSYYWESAWNAFEKQQIADNPNSQISSSTALLLQAVNKNPIHSDRNLKQALSDNKVSATLKQPCTSPRINEVIALTEQEDFKRPMMK